METNRAVERFVTSQETAEQNTGYILLFTAAIRARPRHRRHPIRDRMIAEQSILNIVAARAGPRACSHSLHPILYDRDRDRIWDWRRPLGYGPREEVAPVRDDLPVPATDIRMATRSCSACTSGTSLTEPPPASSYPRSSPVRRRGVQRPRASASISTLPAMGSIPSSLPVVMWFPPISIAKGHDKFEPVASLPTIPPSISSSGPLWTHTFRCSSSTSCPPYPVVGHSGPTPSCFSSSTSWPISAEQHRAAADAHTQQLAVAVVLLVVGNKQLQPPCFR